MQRSLEASFKSLQPKVFPCDIQDGNPIKGFPESDFWRGIWLDLISHLVVSSLSLYMNIISDPATHMILAPSQTSLFFLLSEGATAVPDDCHYYTSSAVSQFPYAAFNTFSQSYPNEFQFQDFQYFVSVTGQLLACFGTYVRPTCNQFLSDFCKDLTGIQQLQPPLIPSILLYLGVTLSEALLKHDKWLEIKGIKKTNFAVVTWSNWDCGVMLESECQFKKKIRKPPYFSRKLIFPPSHFGLSWQGRAHCGLDDARNTAQLLSVLMHRGFKFSITNSLMWQATDPPMTTWTPSSELPSFSPHQLYMLNDTNVPQCQYRPYCFCGVRSIKGMFRKQGSMKGSSYFGCGNWTAT
ncbi:hypothetical protein UlMin_026911 [Ulmus minor]